MISRSLLARYDRAWYERPAAEVARAMLGALVIVNSDAGQTVGRIVETEAYLGESDAASHANLYRRGRQALLRDAGSVYMYRAYGIHMMFNVVTDGPGISGAVLVRAIEPLDGIGLMIARRGHDRLPDLGRGPGNVASALGLRLEDDNLDLTTSDRAMLAAGSPPDQIAVSTRIGITRNPDALLRFFDPSSQAVSGRRRAERIEPVANELTERSEPPGSP